VRNKAFHADRGLPIPPVRQSAIDHLDTADGAISTPQIERSCALPALKVMPDLYVIGLAACVNDLEIKHLNVSAACKEAYSCEAALAAADPYRVAFRSEIDFLTSQFDPVTVAAAAVVIAVSPLGIRIGRMRDP
jgi:hypothetical protein